MSGLLITAWDDGPIEEFVPSMRAWPEETTWDFSMVRAIRGAITRLGVANDWAPAHDPISGLTVVILGRFVPPATGWADGASPGIRGGKIPRGLLSRWRECPADAVAEMNGACVWVVADQRRRTLDVVTDRLGIQPLYIHACSTLTLCSDADVLAEFARSRGCHATYDRVSLGEMLATGCVSQPFTYYDGVSQLEPAARYCWDLDRPHAPPDVQYYWRPSRAEDRALDDQTAVAVVVDALRGAMQRRQQPENGAATLLLSGGLDSRALLFAAPAPSKIRCATFCDYPNAETNTSVRIAAAVEASHVVWRRDEDHYAAGAQETVQWSGGMGSIAEGHFAGFGDRWRELINAPLLTGCYADYLLKGLALNRDYRMFLGRHLPERTLGVFSSMFYKHHVGVESELQSALAQRLQSRFGNPAPAAYPEQALVIADMRIRPLSREADCAGRLWLLRHMDWDPVFADSAIVEAYGQLTISQILNGDVLNRAVQQLSPARAKHIRDINTSATVGASIRRRNVEFIVGSVQRKLRELIWPPTPLEKTCGSWPDMHYYVPRSEQIRGLWTSISLDTRSRISSLAGNDPWAHTLAEWGAMDPAFFLRVLTLALWLDRNAASHEWRLSAPTNRGVTNVLSR